jgi:hypothetical protein
MRSTCHDVRAATERGHDAVAVGSNSKVERLLTVRWFCYVLIDERDPVRDTTRGNRVLARAQCEALETEPTFGVDLRDIPIYSRNSG